MNKKSYAVALFRQSLADLNASENIKINFPAHSLYFLTQCIEKVLKGILVEAKESNINLFTHDLESYIKTCLTNRKLISQQTVVKELSKWYQKDVKDRIKYLNDYVKSERKENKSLRYPIKQDKKFIAPCDYFTESFATNSLKILKRGILRIIKTALIEVSSR